MSLTETQILNNAHIPTSGIEADIAQNNKDIEMFKKELEVASYKKDRLGIIKAEKNLREISEFQENLLQILDYRLTNLKA
jgi:hypothetical protein